MAFGNGVPRRLVAFVANPEIEQAEAAAAGFPNEIVEEKLPGADTLILVEVDSGEVALDTAAMNARGEGRPDLAVDLHAVKLDQRIAAIDRAADEVAEERLGACLGEHIVDTGLGELHLLLAQERVEQRLGLSTRLRLEEAIAADRRQRVLLPAHLLPPPRAVLPGDHRLEAGLQGDRENRLILHPAGKVTERIVGALPCERLVPQSENVHRSEGEEDIVEEPTRRRPVERSGERAIEQAHAVVDVAAAEPFGDPAEARRPLSQRQQEQGPPAPAAEDQRRRHAGRRRRLPAPGRDPVEALVDRHHGMRFEGPARPDSSAAGSVSTDRMTSSTAAPAATPAVGGLPASERSRDLNS